MKRLLAIVASAAILSFAPQAARPGALYDAVIRGDYQKVSRFVASGWFEDAGDLGTALNAAIARGDIDIAVLLIDHGAGIEATRGFSEMRPLHTAVNYKQPALVSLLLARGARVDARDGFGRTPLLIAAGVSDAEIARKLLDRGADVNATGKMNYTPLHWAVIRGRRDLFNLLIDFGADVNALSIHGQSPLHLAAAAGSSEMIGRLAALGADLDVRGVDGQTPLMLAKGNNHEEAAALLIRLGALE
jgi:ankyrin repeat protein